MLNVENELGERERGREGTKIPPCRSLECLRYGFQRENATTRINTFAVLDEPTAIDRVIRGVLSRVEINVVAR